MTSIGRAVEKAVKKAASPKKSRAKRQSDDVYNARRRYRRQAQRYLAKAEQSSGLERARYEAQARNATMQAMRTYGKGQPVQGQIKELAERLNITERTFAAQAFAKGAKGGGISATNLSRLIEQSYSALRGKEAKTRDDMARSILSTGNVGSRFYGGLVQVWDETEESRQHPNRAILEFFGAESIMDVLEELEAQGIDLYTPDENDDVYMSAQLKLQQYILKARRIRKNGE